MKIKELDMFNGSYHDSFCEIYNMIGYETEQLFKKYHSDFINDIKSYQRIIIHKAVKTIFTLYKVISDLKDYNSAGALIRVIADNLSSYNLIYHETDEEKKLLRHYLFILDGLSKRLKLFCNHTPKYDGKISVEDYDILYNKVANAQDNTIKSIDFCKEQIHNLDLYQKHRNSIDTYLKNGNWKFSDFNKPKDKYPWSALYKKLGINDTLPDIFGFLSQYVHGLSISNLIIDLNDDELFEPYYSYGIVMLNIVRNFIENDFGMSRKELLNGFEKTTLFKDFYMCLSEDYKRKAMEIIENSKNNTAI